MITNGGVTLWHMGGYDKVTRMDKPFVRQYFPAASIQKDIKVTINNDEGFQSADVLQIRIPGAAEIAVKNGDRLLPGKHMESEPPQEAFFVKGFADNRKGSVQMWHWKVICG